MENKREFPDDETKVGNFIADKNTHEILNWEEVQFFDIGITMYDLKIGDHVIVKEEITHAFLQHNYKYLLKHECIYQIAHGSFDHHVRLQGFSTAHKFPIHMFRSATPVDIAKYRIYSGV